MNYQIIFMNRLQHPVFLTFIWLALIICSFGGEKAYSEKRALKLHQRVSELVAKHYYDPDLGGKDWNAIAKKGRRIMQGADNWEQAYDVIRQMLNKLDDAHTFVWPPNEYRKKLEDAFVGVGFQTFAHTEEPDLNIVSHVIAGSPAAEVGIERGWLFLNSSEIRNQARIVGESRCYRFLDRFERVREIELQATPMANWKSAWIRKDFEGDIVYLRMDNFNEGVGDWLRDQLETISVQNAVILDVRWNPGGLLGELTQVLEQLVPNGTQVGSIKSRNGKSQRWMIKKKNDQRRPQRYCVVLISNYSASSAEILASVVQNEKLGVVMGVAPTAGEVLFSPSWELPGGGLLKIAARDFVDSRGKRLQGNGVTPDLVTQKQSFFELRRGIDPTIDAAISHLHKNK